MTTAHNAALRKNHQTPRSHSYVYHRPPTLSNASAFGKLGVLKSGIRYGTAPHRTATPTTLTLHTPDSNSTTLWEKDRAGGLALKMLKESGRNIKARCSVPPELQLRLVRNQSLIQFPLAQRNLETYKVAVDVYFTDLGRLMRETTLYTVRENPFTM